MYRLDKIKIKKETITSEELALLSLYIKLQEEIEKVIEKIDFATFQYVWKDKK